VEGLSQREVANRMSLAESTVEKHMGRATRLLMDHFGRGGKFASEASTGLEESAIHTRHGQRTEDQ
jgi:RNA polymerase sigma-70 factor (ECF subfamily)